MAGALNSGTIRNRHHQHHHCHENANPQVQDANIQSSLRQSVIARQHACSTLLKLNLFFTFIVTTVAVYHCYGLYEQHILDAKLLQDIELKRIDKQRDREITLLKDNIKLKQKLELKKLEEQTKKELAEMKLNHERQLKHMELTALKELEMHKEIEFLRLQKELEVKKLNARTEIYTKAFESKKVIKTVKYLGGLITTHHEEIESPLKESRSLHMIKKSMEPHLGLVQNTKIVHMKDNTNLDDL